MSYTYKKWYQTQALGAGNTALPVVPAGTVHQVRSFTVHNPTAGVITFEAHLVLAAGSSASTNQILKRAIGVNETYLCPEMLNKTLTAGDFVSVAGTSLNLEMSVAEVVQ